MKTIRKAAVADRFYPGNPAELKSMIHELYSHAADQPAVGKVLIAPHAGFIYSGPIAASCYAPLKKRSETIKKVVLLGPDHYVGFSGIAVPQSEYFETPLGEIEIDKDLKETALKNSDVVEFEQAHFQEHSLETHLPFLQESLNSFTLLPIVISSAKPESVAELLLSLWGDEETLIVISTDLSHFKNYEDASSCDLSTVLKISELDSNFDHYDACGSGPLKGFILAAKKKNLIPKLIDYRNSGDTAGDKNRVVGYASFICDTKEKLEGVLSTKEQESLIELAKFSIAKKLGLEYPEPESFECTDKIATFVTLKLNGELRGCIGTLTAHRPLLEDVRENALSAAFRDPRFEPLSKDEFKDISISISLLTKPEDISFSSEEDLLSQIRPGIDGLIIRDGNHRGTFLPSVWDDLPDKELFWKYLKRKAGLPQDYWSSSMEVQRYTSVYIN